MPWIKWCYTLQSMGRTNHKFLMCNTECSIALELTVPCFEVQEFQVHPWGFEPSPERPQIAGLCLETKASSLPCVELKS